MTEPTGNVTVATSIQQGPDGTNWVGIHINAPLVAFAVAVPVDSADTLAEQLPEMLRQTAKQARRANSGLVIAQTLPKTN